MSEILVSIHGKRLGLDVNGNLLIDGTAAAFGANVGNGTVSAPTIAFTSDSNTGFYRIGSHNIGLATNGVKAWDVSSSLITNSLPMVFLGGTTITAFSTGGQASATALTADYNNVTTVAADYDSVKLPAASLGRRVVVKNSGASILSVFPVTSGTIAGLAVNLSIDIPVGGEVTFAGISSTAYVTNARVLTSHAPSTQKGDLVIKAADNAGNTQTIITNASFGQASTLTIPDPGGATGNFILNTTVGSVQSSRCSAQLDSTSTTTLASITGLSQALLVGTYSFQIDLYGTAGASGGWKVAFKLNNSLAISAINTNAKAFTASAIATNNNTTTTDQTSMIAATTAYTSAVITGTVVVSTAGTFQVQFAQNASDSTTCSIYVGSSMSFRRIA